MTGTRRRRTAAAIALVGSVAAVVLGSGGAGAQVDGSAPCPAPYAPIFAEAWQYGPGADGREVPPPEGPSIDHLARSFEPPDTDGDGRPDTVEHLSQVLVIGRGDGQLVLRAPEGGSVGVPSGRITIGDLDGDGRDDIFVFTATGPVVDERIDTVYVVLGSTPAGEHDTDVVGIEMPVPLGGYFVGVGDQDGDGADDVATGPGPDTLIISGRQLVAPGPGGSLSALPEPLRTVPGMVMGALQLTPGAAPILALTHADEGTVVEVTLLTDPPLALRTDRVPFGPGRLPEAHVSGFLSDGDRIVTLGYGPNRSGSAARWMWNLDDLCASPTLAPVSPPSTVPTSPPASPVRATPTYTG